MENKEKIGVLSYVAAGGNKGIQFVDEPGVWYNPVDDEAKNQVTPDYLGTEVKIVLVGDSNNFSTIALEKVKEERVVDNPKEEVKDVKKDYVHCIDCGLLEDDCSCKKKVIAPVDKDPKVVEETMKQLEEGKSIIKDHFVISDKKVEDLSILDKLSRIQFELKVPKSQTNNFANFSYRSTSDILEALKPYLKKYEVSIVIKDSIFGREGMDRIYIQATACIMDNSTKETIEVSAFAREQKEKKGMDEAQITGSASSYARKYALNGLFAIDDAVDIDKGKND